MSDKYREKLWWYQGLPPQDPMKKPEDTEIWRKDNTDQSPVIRVTECGMISIKLNHHEIIMSVESWHRLGVLKVVLEDVLDPNP